MQVNKEFNKENDTMAAIGIGAMIVFIALILVAAVASAVIIQTGEKLQQNAQETGDDTQNSMRGKVKIVGAYKTNGPVYNFILVASP
jgi:flagellin FlaB